MKNHGTIVLWGLAALLFGFILIGVGINLAITPHLAYETDRSSLDFTALSDGRNPWLTLALQKDPSDNDLRHLRWSPNGRTLAYLEDQTLRTWNPGSALRLPDFKPWKGPVWSPDGQFIVVSSPEKTLVIDAQTMNIRRELSGDDAVWWCSGSMGYGERLNASIRKKSDVQTIHFASRTVNLPAGLSLEAASPDGKVIVAQNNFAGGPSDTGTFELLGMEARNGTVIWIKPAPRSASKNFAAPDVVWNDKYQMAVQSADDGGGFDLHGYALVGDNVREIKFASAADYCWISGCMDWTGQELFAPLTLARIGKVSGAEMNIHFWNELALFDGKTYKLRCVSSGIPFECAAASGDYVAFETMSPHGPQIVVSPWIKDGNGRIVGVSYSDPHPVSNAKTGNLARADRPAHDSFGGEDVLPALAGQLRSAYARKSAKGDT